MSRLGDCQHHGGRELAVRDMVNPGEVPIKAVIINKPKMLSGLDQNGTWSGIGGWSIPRRGWCTTGRKARPYPGVIEEMNEVTPLPPREGRRTAKNADEAAVEG